MDPDPLCQAHRQLRPEYRRICANYFFDVEKGQFKYSTGAQLVGPPLYPERIGPKQIDLK